MNKQHFFLRADIESVKKFDPNAIQYGEDLISTSLTEEEAQSFIPEGTYCYSRVNGKFIPCPFWDKMENLPDQMSGFCHYLKEGDFTRGGTFLLWDQCKECGVKDEYIKVNMKKSLDK